MVILWTDTETTGTVITKHTIVQLAAAIENDKGEIVDTFNQWMCPLIGYEIDPKALEVIGKTKEEVMAGRDPFAVFEEFDSFLNKYGFRGNKEKRYVPGGYCNKFDLDMLSDWYSAITDGPYKFWDFLQFNPIDPSGAIISLWRLGKLPGLKDCKLSTVCKYFGIEIKAHDALSDLMATRALSKLIYANFSLSIDSRNDKS